MLAMLTEQSVVASLARTPLFAGLEQPALERLSIGMRTRRYRRGEVVYHAGDPGDSLLVIVSGEVKLALPSETGEEAILSILRDGDVFGMHALLDGDSRLGTASALVVTEVILLHQDQFRGLIDSQPVVRDRILASLSHELRRLTVHVEELHFLDITGRLAAQLVRLASEADPGGGDGPIRLRPSLTQAELASMVGCTRQSVNKLLGRFALDGLLNLDRAGIVITDRNGLKATARR